MQRTDVASRRFFRAFYSWTTLLHHADTAGLRHPARGTALVPTHHCATFHTTVRRQRGEDLAKGRNNGKSKVGREQGVSIGTGEVPCHARSSTTEGGTTHNVPDFTNEPVRKAMEIPFHRLKPDEAVLRYRTPNGKYMVEFAARIDRLDALQSQYGQRLERLSKQSQANIQVQDVTAAIEPADADGTAGLHMVSVLISGKLREVTGAVRALKLGSIRDVTPQNLNTQLFLDSKLARPAMFEAKFVPPRDKTLLPREAYRSKVLALPGRKFVGRFGKTMLLVGTAPFLEEARRMAQETIDLQTSQRTVRSEDTTFKELTRQRFYEQASVSDGINPYLFQIRGPKSAELVREILKSGDTGGKPGFKVGARPVPLWPYAENGRSGLRFQGSAEMVRLARNGLETIAHGIRKAKGWPRHDFETLQFSSSKPEVTDQREILSDKESATDTLKWHFFEVAGPNASGVVEEVLAQDLTREDLLITKPDGSRLRMSAFVENGKHGLKFEDSTEGAVQVISQLKILANSICEAKLWPSHSFTSSELYRLAEDILVSARLPETVRPALRALINPVVVVTAGDPNVKRQSQYDLAPARGVTVSSFNTVTLTPLPVVSLNLKLPSRTWDAIAASGRLRIHFLSANPRGAAVAHAFTQPHERPHEAFEYLRRVGIKVHQAAKRGFGPPRLMDLSGDALMGGLSARVLTDKCVTVGDHVIVVAEVFGYFSSNNGEKREPKETLALSYAMRAYRGPEGAIEPQKLPVLSDEDVDATEEAQHSAVSPSSEHEAEGGKDLLRLGEELAKAAGSKDSKKQRIHDEPQRRVARQADLYREPIGDSMYDALRMTRDAADSGEQVDVHKQYSKQTPSKDEEDYDFGFEKTPASSKSSKLGSSWNRSIPTLARPCAPVRRMYSTSSARYRHVATGPTSELDTKTIAHPSTLQTTVADYLGIPENSRPLTSRLRRVRLRQSLALAARRRLADAESGIDPLSAQELETLTSEATSHERHVAKKLAWNAAADLRVMLDKGRYDTWFFSHIPWIEGCIERGQAVLLEEAKMLRTMLAERKISGEDFEKIRERIRGQNDVLTTETNRLRQVVDEEGDGWAVPGLGEDCEEVK